MYVSSGHFLNELQLLRRNLNKDLFTVSSFVSIKRAFYFSGILTYHGIFFCVEVKFRKGRFPLRKISTESDWTFFHLVLSAPPDTKKLKILQLFIIWVADHRFKVSNWNRKLVPKAHARVQFCSDPV